MAEITLTAENFDEQVLRSELPVLVAVSYTHLTLPTKA